MYVLIKGRLLKVSQDAITISKPLELQNRINTAIASIILVRVY